MNRRPSALALLCLSLAVAGCSDPVRRDAAAEIRATRDARTAEARRLAVQDRRDVESKAAVDAADAEEMNRFN